MKPKDMDMAAPLYVKCAERLREWIATGVYQPGQYIPGERQLSEDFGLNRLTVRKSIEQLVREGLLRKLPGAGTMVVKRKLLVGKELLLGCVMTTNTGEASLDPYYTDIIGGLITVMGRKGHSLICRFISPEITMPENCHLAASELVQSNRLNGVVFLGGMPSEFAVAVRDTGCQVLMVDQQAPRGDIASVEPDNFAAGQKAAEHLIGLGHSRIVFLSPADDPVVLARYNGFLHAHKLAGIEFDQKCFVRGGYKTAAAKEGMSNYIETVTSAPFTAVLAVNDEGAFGAIESLGEHGLKVPDDVSVMGFDDVLQAASYNPSLTTTRLFLKKMGRTAAQILVEMIEENMEPVSLSIRPEVIQRLSTCAPNR